MNDLRFINTARDGNEIVPFSIRVATKSGTIRHIRLTEEQALYVAKSLLENLHTEALARQFENKGKE